MYISISVVITAESLAFLRSIGGASHPALPSSRIARLHPRLHQILPVALCKLARLLPEPEAVRNVTQMQFLEMEDVPYADGQCRVRADVRLKSRRSEALEIRRCGHLRHERALQLEEGPRHRCGYLCLTDQHALAPRVTDKVGLARMEE